MRCEDILLQADGDMVSMPLEFTDSRVISLIVQFDCPPKISEVTQALYDAGVIEPGIHLVPLYTRIWGCDNRPIGIRGRVLEWLLSHCYRR